MVQQYNTIVIKNAMDEKIVGFMETVDQYPYQ